MPGRCAVMGNAWKVCCDGKCLEGVWEMPAGCYVMACGNGWDVELCGKAAKIVVMHTGTI